MFQLLVILFIILYIYIYMYIYIYIYIYPQTPISFFPGLISVDRVKEQRTTDVTRVLKAPGAEFCQNACGMVNEQKILCSHQCSPECSMNKFRAYIYKYIYIYIHIYIYIFIYILYIYNIYTCMLFIYIYIYIYTRATNMYQHIGMYYIHTEYHMYTYGRSHRKLFHGGGRGG